MRGPAQAWATFPYGRQNDQERWITGVFALEAIKNMWLPIILTL